MRQGDERERGRERELPISPYLYRTPDFYHTCYCLSGLSVAQHCYGNGKIIDITNNPDSILVCVRSVPIPCSQT